MGAAPAKDQVNVKVKDNELDSKKPLVSNEIKDKAKGFGTQAVEVAAKLTTTVAVVGAGGYAAMYAIALMGVSPLIGLLILGGAALTLQYIHTGITKSWNPMDFLKA